MREGLREGRGSRLSGFADMSRREPPRAVDPMRLSARTHAERCHREPPRAAALGSRVSGFANKANARGAWLEWDWGEGGAEAATTMCGGGEYFSACRPRSLGAACALMRAAEETTTST